MNSSDLYKRYQRQVILEQLGVPGQEKLLAARVLVVGAGGLGCPALQYLVAGGVGTVGIIDDDVVALSNLHRQVLFTMQDIGVSKALKARDHLQQLNDEIIIAAYNERLTVENAPELFSGYDIVIDGTDNFATRYLINDACVLMNKPLVYGAVSQFEGQVAVFNVSSKDEPALNYRDLYPEPPKAGEVQNCAEAGVLGVLPGIIGTMQANEAIKLITGLGEPLVNRLLTYNALTTEVYKVYLQRGQDTNAFIPVSKEAFKQMDYDWLCSSSKQEEELSPLEFDHLLATGNPLVIDVREPGEFPEITAFGHSNIPLRNIHEINPGNEAIIVFCQSGKRSMQAVQVLLNRFGESRKIYSLQGGIINWLQKHQTA